MLSKVQLPSDFLIDNHKSLQRRNVYNRITPLMKDIEYLLGQPQGSFAV